MTEEPTVNKEQERNLSRIMTVRPHWVYQMRHQRSFMNVGLQGALGGLSVSLEGNSKKGRMK